MLWANKMLNSKYGQDDERRWRNERWRGRQTGGCGMTRGNTATNQAGQEATATENKRAATTNGGAKRGRGVAGREVLAQHQWMIRRGSRQNNATIK
jgi:hypothetical protein